MRFRCELFIFVIMPLKSDQALALPTATVITDFYRLVKHQSLSCMPFKNLMKDMCIGDSSEIHNRCVRIRLLLS